MKALLQKYSINEDFTKVRKEPTVYNRFKNNIPLLEDYNFMADLLLLPETEKGYKYLLVVVDIASDEFDIEPLKNKTSEDVLNGFKKIIKRKYLKLPKGSLRTDSGSEFKGVFHKWLLDKEVFHKYSLPNRHKQMANVESLNKQLGRIFNGYMNFKEEQTGEMYKEWTDILDEVRTDLNQVRKKKLKDYIDPDDYPVFDIQKAGKQKYDIGSIVYEKLDWAENALGKKQPTPQFRQGDYRFSKTPKKVEKVVYMNDKPYYRYILSGLPNVSYSEAELMQSKEKTEKFKVKKIIGSKIEKKKKFYLVHWKGYLKKDATWELEKTLLEDGLEEYIKDFKKKT
jgi:hypothetical protein